MMHSNTLLTAVLLAASALSATLVARPRAAEIGAVNNLGRAPLTARPAVSAAALAARLTNALARDNARTGRTGHAGWEALRRGRAARTPSAVRRDIGPVDIRERGRVLDARLHGRPASDQERVWAHLAAMEARMRKHLTYLEPDEAKELAFRYAEVLDRLKADVAAAEAHYRCMANPSSADWWALVEAIPNLNFGSLPE
jgi:hypothetical protein